MSDTQPQLYDVRASAERLSLGAAMALGEQWAGHRRGRILVYRRRRWIGPIGRVVVAELAPPAITHPTPWTVSYDGDDDRAWLVDAAGRDVRIAAVEVLHRIADAVNTGGWSG